MSLAGCGSSAFQMQDRKLCGMPMTSRGRHSWRWLAACLSGKGGYGLWRPRRRIVRGVECPSLGPKQVAVDALGQALKIGVRDAARSEVLAPSVNGPNDANDLGGRLRRRVAEELALRHGVGKR